MITFIGDIHGNHEALVSSMRPISRKGGFLRKTYCFGDLLGEKNKENNQVITHVNRYLAGSVLSITDSNRLKNLLSGSREYLMNCPVSKELGDILVSHENPSALPGKSPLILTEEDARTALQDSLHRFKLLITGGSPTPMLWTAKSATTLCHGQKITLNPDERYILCPGPVDAEKPYAAIYNPANNEIRIL